MPMFEKANSTDASHSQFTEQHDNQYNVTYNIVYNVDPDYLAVKVTPPETKQLDEIEFQGSDWQQTLRACAKETTSCQSTLTSAIKPGANQTFVTVPYGAWNNGNTDITVNGSWGGWADPCGSWSYSADAEVSLAFYGSAIYYMGYKDLTGGTVRVTVDGIVTTLDLYAPSRMCGILYRKTTLDSKLHHKITIVLAGASPQNMSNTVPRMIFHSFIALTPEKPAAAAVIPSPSSSPDLALHACTQEGTISCHTAFVSAMKADTNKTVTIVPCGAWKTRNRYITAQGSWHGLTEPCGCWSFHLDAMICLTFSGSSIYFMGFKDSTGGNVKVTVDALSTTIDLYAPSKMCGVLYSKTGLDSKRRHRIMISLTRSESPRNTANSAPRITFHSFMVVG